VPEDGSIVNDLQTSGICGRISRAAVLASSTGSGRRCVDLSFKHLEQGAVIAPYQAKDE